jgi:hypothetical protein
MDIDKAHQIEVEISKVFYSADKMNIVGFYQTKGSYIYLDMIKILIKRRTIKNNKLTDTLL